MKKKLSLLFVLLVLAVPLLAQEYYDEDEELMTVSHFLWGVIGGGIAGAIGYAISQVKPISGLGKVIMFIGWGYGGLTLLVGVLQLVSMILAAAFSLAWKLAIVAVIIGVAYTIISGIIKWFKGDTG